MLVVKKCVWESVAVRLLEKIDILKSEKRVFITLLSYIVIESCSVFR